MQCLAEVAAVKEPLVDLAGGFGDDQKTLFLHRRIEQLERQRLYLRLYFAASSALSGQR